MAKTRKIKNKSRRRGGNSSSAKPAGTLSHSEIRYLLGYRKGVIDQLSAQLRMEQSEVQSLEAMLKNASPASMPAPAKAAPKAAPAASSGKRGRPPGSVKSKPAKASKTTKPATAGKKGKRGRPRVEAVVPTGNFNAGWSWKQKILYILNQAGKPVSSAHLLAFLQKHDAKNYDAKKTRNTLSQYLISMKSKGELSTSKASKGKGYLYGMGKK